MRTIYPDAPLPTLQEWREYLIRQRQLREALKEANDIIEIVAEDSSGKLRIVLNCITEKNRLL